MSDGIDLASLPAPTVVETLSYERIVSEMRALAAQLSPIAFAELRESDPAMKLIEVFAYRELLLRARVNDAASENLVTSATGSNLDHLGALLGVERKVLDPGNPDLGVPPTLEGDEAFRARIVTASYRWSVAGPKRAYEAFALEASEQVARATAYSPQPGLVYVAIAGFTNDLLPQEVIDAVQTYLSAETKRPLTDSVTVLAATALPLSIGVDVYFENSSELEANIEAFLDRCDALEAVKRPVGVPMQRGEVYSALLGPGVLSLEMGTPFNTSEAEPSAMQPFEWVAANLLVEGYVDEPYTELGEIYPRPAVFSWEV